MMDKEDRRRYFIFGSGIIEIGNPVLRYRLEQDYMSHGLGSLQDFLNSQPVVHTLYHLRHRNMLCCKDQLNCKNFSSLPLINCQWKCLYTEASHMHAHYCHCKYSSKPVCLNDLNIDLLSLILLNCCNVSKDEEMSIRTLMRLKTCFLSHNITFSMNECEFNSAWNDLENCILQLDIKQQDNIIRILHRPLDEALCLKYSVYLIDIQKQLNEIDVKINNLSSTILQMSNGTTGTEHTASFCEHGKKETHVEEKLKPDSHPNRLYLKIKDKIETKERKNYLQILAFILGDKIAVVQACIELLISKDMCKTFEDFLNTNKHGIFHEYTPNYPCCCCDKVSLASSLKRRSLYKEEFYLIYNQNKQEKTHVIKRGNKIVQHCICGITAKKSVNVDLINTNMAIMIIRKFSTKTFQQRIWIHKIKQVMCGLVNNGKRQIEESRFKKFWSSLELSILSFEGSMPDKYHYNDEKQIDFQSKLIELPSVEENRSVTTIIRSLNVRYGLLKLSCDCSKDSHLTKNVLAKMLYLSFSLGIDVVHTYFETVILKDTVLHNYLKTKKHFLFHQYLPHVLCCECKTKHVGFKKLNKVQFNKLYVEVSTNCCGTIDKERKCICKYEPCKSLFVDDIDIFVISTILNDSFPPITNLRNVSKFLLFNITSENTKLLYEKCQMLQKCVIDIAGSVEDTFCGDIRREIRALNLGGTEITMLLGNVGLNSSYQQPLPSSLPVTQTAAEYFSFNQMHLSNKKLKEKLPEVNGPWKGKLCESCEFRNIKVNAEVGCLVCDQCICKPCLDHHKATKIFQDHPIVPLDEYMQRPDNKEFVCDKHSLNLDVFCVSHDSPYCFKCILQDHKSCSVIEMKEAEEQFKTYRFKNLKERTDNLLKNVQSTYKSALTDVNSYNHKKGRLMQEFDKKFKLSVDRYKTHFIESLDNNERTTAEIAKDLKDQEDILKTLTTSLPSISMSVFSFQTMSKVIEIEQKLTEQEKYFKELDGKKKLISSELDIRLDISTSKNSENKHDNSSANSNLKSLQVESLRKQNTKDIMNFHLEKESTFKLPTAKKEIQIRGCAILDDNTACFADHGNSCLIFMTTKGYSKKSKLPSAPLDITCIKGTRIAVTLYDSKSIQIFDTEKWELEEFLFSDKNGLTGIAFSDDLIIARAGGTGYCIVNLKGKKIGAIRKPDSNMPYVACAKENFVSAKWDTNEVYCFDKSGKTLWQFKDESIIKPANGVSADIDGNVYVTGSYSNSVAVISSDGKKCKQLINSSTNLDNPIAIDYHKTNNKLLVSAASGHAVLYSVIRN